MNGILRDDMTYLRRHHGDDVHGEIDEIHLQVDEFLHDLVRHQESVGGDPNADPPFPYLPNHFHKRGMYEGFPDPSEIDHLQIGKLRRIVQDFFKQSHLHVPFLIFP